MVRLNLLPPEILEKRKYEGYLPYVYLVGVAVLLVVLMTTALFELLIAQRRSDLAKSDAVIHQMNEQAAALEIFVHQEQVLADRETVATNALDQRVDVGRLAEDVSLVLPQPLWLNSLEINQDNGLTIAGWTPDSAGTEVDEGYKSVASGLVRLNAIGDLFDIWLTRATSAGASDRTVDGVSGTAYLLNYEITAKIRKPASSIPSTSVPAPPSGTE